MSIKATLTKVHRWFRPTCAEDGCDRASSRWASTCEDHFAQSMAEAGRRIAHREFERKVEVHLEALRRFDAEKSQAAVEPSTGSGNSDEPPPTDRPGDTAGRPVADAGTESGRDSGRGGAAHRQDLTPDADRGQS